ncbi:C10 family peptidase [Chryseobacterium arthrosphaerae]|uniref:C10 family peptidase n=1 Tax=Chryseobacterium arthrosphaerae TaxID=651561 RepID=UPI0023E0E07A|nr:C10 family peptidase [Chryseobacterium arthrosphaerae]WET00052.1 C10 family peptidase [Chryseobacterium arthrosphaerae]
MKPIQLLSVILLMMYNTGYSQISKSQIPAQKPAIMDAPFLLKTNWDQWGIYAKYTPENHVLGCWSTAMAQILYYHRLEPSGIVSYTCSKGYMIKDNLSHYFPVWKHFTESINNHSNPETIDAVARYSYLTALAVRKDFGTSRYLEMINPAPQIEKHFTCKAVFYGSFTGDVPFSQEQLKSISEKEEIRHIINKDRIIPLIKNEIGHQRPVYFHMGNFTTYGHSTVIDGYVEKEGIFYVHLNYGAGGFRTGWYDLFKPIDVKDDIRLRAFVTIEPGK